MAGESPSDPRVEVYRRVMDGFRDQDLVTVQSGFSPDVILDAAGKSSLAGRYEGWGAVLAYIAKSMMRFVPETAVIESVTADAGGVEAIVSGGAKLKNGEVVRLRIRQYFAFDESNRIRHVAVRAAGDQDEFDRIVDG